MRLYRSLFFLVFIFFVKFSQAQIPVSWDCADEKLRTLQQKLTPGYNNLLQQNDILLKEYIGEILKNRSRPVFNSQARTTADSAFFIPVVVHVIHPSGEPYGSGANISYGQIRSQLEALNAAFSKSYPGYNGQTHPGYAQDTRIKFCLARNTSDTATWFKGPGGTEFGVKRYAANSGAYNHDISLGSASQLLKLTHPVPERFPFDKYLNIWVVKTIGGGNNVMGYAPRPIINGYPLDGLVIRSDIFGDNSAGGNHLSNPFGLAQGKVLAHEVGHYFNLYHIFQGGCTGANASGSATDACDLNGDMICDIEPSATQNIFCNTSIPNSCTANYATGTTDLDMINDYMSYADDDCMNTFTMDQAKRMWATLNLQRRTLWQPENLTATGVLGTNGCIPSYLNAQINTTDALFCANKPVTFSNPSAGNTATTYQWQFVGANISSANTKAVTVTFTTAGNYKAVLRVSDGTNFRTDSLLFTVLDCKLDSSMLYMSNWYFGNFGSINFSSGSPIPSTTALVNNSIQGESAYPGQLPYIGSTVSLSDSSGNLLFYSNGVSVWNSSHKKITSSPIFGASDINASSGFSYIPFPGQPGKYFVAGVYPNFNETLSGVRFALVDINNNTVSPYQEFSHPSLPNRFSQYLAVVPHCNGTDYWIITHGQGWTQDNRFFSFLVTSSGIDKNQTPVISTGFLQTGYGGSGMQLKSNRKGDKLILTSPNPYQGTMAALYDFDNTTGQIKNERVIPNVSGFNNIQSGTAFSPNGDYFYFFRTTNFATGGLPYFLFQYRVSDLQYNIIDAPGFYFAASMQPGPDNQIYVTTQDHFFARISNPDKWGEVTVNGSFINMRQLSDNIRPGVSIPSFIDARKPLPAKPEFTIEAINCNTFRFLSKCFDNYTVSWNFGDGSPVLTGNSIIHQYLQPGDFNVVLSLSNGTTTIGSVSKKINVVSISSTISGPDNVCTNGNFPSQYFSPILQGASYKWYVLNGRISGSDNFPFVDIIWLSSSGIGKVELQITKDNCSFLVSKNVSLTEGPEFKWMLRDSICVYDSSFVLDITPAGGIFTGPGVTDNRFSPLKAGLGNHTITYTYFNELTCLGQIEKTIKVSNCNIPVNANDDCGNVLNTIQVAPNPVEKVLTFKSAYHLLNFVQVYNSGGQKVAEGQLINNSLRLPVLGTGIYTALVYCNKNLSYKSIRFLKVN